jgi:hypothetical protein
MFFSFKLLLFQDFFLLLVVVRKRLNIKRILKREGRILKREGKMASHILTTHVQLAIIFSQN